MLRCNGFKWIVSLFLLLAVAGCASLPDDLQQQPSCCWPLPEETDLGRFIAGAEGYQPGLSGVELIATPEDAFRARFYIASLAQHTLDLQYYLWKTDLTGQLLLWRALEAADRGVRVRFLIDDIFHSGRDDLYALLDTHPHFEVRVFNPIADRGMGRWLKFAIDKRSLNHRMHNKIFLADNALGVLGGRNIGDDYFGVDTQANFFDLDVLTTGEGARQAGQAFDEYWNSRYAVPIAVLHDEDYTPEDLEQGRRKLNESLEHANALPYAIALDQALVMENLEKWRSELRWVEAWVVVDPLERFEGQGESALVAFAGDHIADIDQHFIVQSAYLIPSSEGLENLARLSAQGIRVRILTNSLMSNNHITAHSGYMKYRKALLQAGAELYELRADAELREHFHHFDKQETPAGIHTKAFIIDDEQTLIGSFNFDPRSRDLNSEIGLAVTDAGFTAEVEQVMDEYFAPENSYRLFLDEEDRLRWELRHPDGTVTVYTKDPESPWWKRATARVLSWLPIESEL